MKKIPWTEISSGLSGTSLQLYMPNTVEISVFEHRGTAEYVAGVFHH